MATKNDEKTFEKLFRRKNYEYLAKNAEPYQIFGKFFEKILETISLSIICTLINEVFIFLKQNLRKCELFPQA